MWLERSCAVKVGAQMVSPPGNNAENAIGDGLCFREGYAKNVPESRLHNPEIQLRTRSDGFTAAGSTE